LCCESASHRRTCCACGGLCSGVGGEHTSSSVRRRWRASCTRGRRTSRRETLGIKVCVGSVDASFDPNGTANRIFVVVVCVCVCVCVCGTCDVCDVLHSSNTPSRVRGLGRRRQAAAQALHSEISSLRVKLLRAPAHLSPSDPPLLTRTIDPMLSHTHTPPRTSFIQCPRSARSRRCGRRRKVSRSTLRWSSGTSCSASGFSLRVVLDLLARTSRTS
jgi:hypothetical protein